MTIISEPEAYATTEPVMASDQTAAGSPDRPMPSSARDRRGHRPRGRPDHEHTDRGATTTHPPRPVRRWPRPTTATAAPPTWRRSPRRSATTRRPTRDWAADEGELLEETHDRGDRLEAERADLAHEADDAAARASSRRRGRRTASDDDTASDDATDTTASGGRRISAFDELRDGGFGVGSAAPLEDGAQPLDHPVQAYRDTMTYRLPGDAGYDSAEPHVWFYDEGAAAAQRLPALRGLTPCRAFRSARHATRRAARASHTRS